METLIIRDANKNDSDLIADAILDAIGEELTMNLAGDTHTREDVHTLFKSLAEREDSQYSYLNSRIAENGEGTPMGVCVSYPGNKLIPLRRAFFNEAIEKLGWEMDSASIDSLPKETEDDEFYLDSLMTLPEFRGKGVASALIKDAKKKADAAGLPLGLLCDTDNERARRLYDSLGFLPHARRPFAGKMMDNLRLS